MPHRHTHTHTPIEISKRYGEAESASFVNGILDALKRKYRDHPEAANP